MADTSGGGGAAAAAGGVAPAKAGKKRFEVKKWNAVALWAWVRRRVSLFQ